MSWVAVAPMVGMGCTRYDDLDDEKQGSVSNSARTLTGTQIAPEFELKLVGRVVRGSRIMAQLQFVLDGKALVLSPGPGAVLIAKQKLKNELQSAAFKKTIQIKDAATKQILGSLAFGPLVHAGTPGFALEQHVIAIDSNSGESRVTTLHSRLANGKGQTIHYQWRWPVRDAGLPAVVP
jgi:hypothetical protein